MPLSTETAYRSFADQALHYFIRPHVGVPETPLSSAAAWTGADLRHRQDEWGPRLNDSQIRELSDAADRLLDQQVPLGAVTRETFSLPTLSAALRGWRDEIATGRGFVLLRGIPVSEWGEEKSAYAYWGLGHHLGEPGAQNAAEELLGHVRNYGDQGAELTRQYRTTENIQFHCDAADAVGLLCLQPARSGGQSRIVSSVTVFNEMLARRPDLAARLFQPFALDRRNEQGPGEPGHLPIQPCCLGDDGVLRTFYHGEYFRSAQRFPDVELDPAGAEAIALYDEICADPSVHLDMWLESGDMQFISNHTLVHARTGYEDWPEPERQRHLLRLWLSFPNAG